MEKLLTIKDVAELLDVKISTLYYWVHIGYIPHVKVGKLVRFRECDIENWINKRASPGRSSHKISQDSLDICM